MVVAGAARWTLFTALLLGSVTACSSRADPPHPGPTPDASASASGTVTASPPEPRTTADATGERVLPPALVGAWRSDSKGSDAGITYRFRADGGYSYVGVLAYDSPDGVVQITFTSEGTARTEGAQLILEPTMATKSREDPSDPEGDYAGMPAARTPQRHTWEVTGDVLALTDKEGLRVTYERRSR